MDDCTGVCRNEPGMNRAISSFILVVAIATLLLGFASPAISARAEPSMATARALSSVAHHTSTTNWAGYAVSTANGAVTDVQGSWVQPAFKGTCGGFYNSSYAVFWVGIDGFNSNTVEQIGTQIHCISVLWVAGVYYSAWYEFYPAG